MNVTGPLNQWGGSSNSSPSWRIEPATESDVVEVCTDVTVFFNGADSWGDGWNGAYWTWTNPSGETQDSGTMNTGSSEKAGKRTAGI